MRSAIKILIVTTTAVMFGAAVAIVIGVRVADDMADVASAVMETLGPPAIVVDGGYDEGVE
jgi:hypothetical protein